MPTMSAASQGEPPFWPGAQPRGKSDPPQRKDLFRLSSVQFHFHWILTTAMEGRYVALFYR